MSARKLADLLKAARIQPAVNQVESHPFLAQARLKAFCGAHGIVLTAYSPLGSPDRPPRLIEDADPAPLHDDVVKGVAAAHGVSPAQVRRLRLTAWSWVAAVSAVESDVFAQAPLLCSHLTQLPLPCSHPTQAPLFLLPLPSPSLHLCRS